MHIIGFVEFQRRVLVLQPFELRKECSRIAVAGKKNSIAQNRFKQRRKCGILIAQALPGVRCGKSGNGRKIAAFGAFTEVSYKTDQELKRTLGHLAYVLGGLNALSTIKSYKAVIEHENGVVEGEFIYGAMSNSLSVAGMVRLNDDLVDLSDGKFEILLVRRPKDVMEVNSILTGVLNKTYDSPCLTVAQSSFVKVTFEEPVPWTRDGEDGGTHRTLTLRSHRHAVDIYC